MEFDLSKIKFSKNDLKKGINIPKNLDSRLAEFVGIIVGDGHIGFYENRNARYPYTHYEVRISGNLKDSDYYSNFINQLAYGLFNTKFSARKPKKENSITLTKDSKAIYYFLKEYFEIPQRKDNVKIPKIILNATDEIKSSFLRGLADSDFCLTIKSSKNYPVIQGTSKSKNLMTQCSKILNDLGIKNYIYCENSFYEKRKKLYTRYCININGFSRVREFLAIVGFSNKLKISNYEKFLEKMAGQKGFEFERS